MYSFFASGAELLDNGHILICDADSGRFIEVDENNNIIWEYINPVTLNGIVEQGTDPDAVSNNAVFKVERYATEYDGLQDKDLTPTEPIETMSDYDCMIISDIADVSLSDDVKVYPNPVSDVLSVSSPQKIESYTIYNTQGQVIDYQSDIDAYDAEIAVDAIMPGSYIIQLSLATKVSRQHFIIIQ